MPTNKQVARIKTSRREGSLVIELGEMEIWDGADLSLLREALAHLIHGKGVRSIGIELKYVKYIPSGFFGMLFDWFDQDVEIRLFEPQYHVKQMLWFRKFFRPVNNDCYELYDVLTDSQEENPLSNREVAVFALPR